MREGARIERLRIKAHARRGVPMVQSAVEDAFRTQLSAAGPVVQRGLLVIRKIDLGPITSRRDQLALNGRLAAILREASRQGGRFTDTDFAAHNAVLFPDPLTPWVHVARCIGEGRAVPLDWPWRAVLGEALFAPRERLAMELVVRQLNGPQAGPGVRAVLLALGEALPELVKAWPVALRKQVLAALCIGRPADAARPVRWLDLHVLALDLRALALQQPILRVLRAWHPADVAIEDVLPVLVAALLSQSGRPVPRDRVDLAVLCLVSAMRHGSSAQQIAGKLPQLADHFEAQAKVLQRMAETGQLVPTISEAVQAVVENFQAMVEATPSESPRSLDGALRDVDAPSAAIGWKESQEAPAAAVDPPSDFERTRHAGIAYLIALIHRAYGRWLNRGEHLPQGTGQRLLARMTARLGLHPEDPAQCFLASLGELPQSDDAPLSFALADDMIGGMGGAVRVARVARHKGWRVASLGRLVIACWQDRAPREVRRLLANRALRRSPPPIWSAEAMLASCEIGLRRYLRSGPRLRMAQLVRRRGALAHTATHLDVSFDAAVIDLAIRRWALDLSPGWCPWLWRVVTIHYDFGDADAT